MAGEEEMGGVETKALGVEVEMSAPLDGKTFPQTES